MTHKEPTTNKMIYDKLDQINRVLGREGEDKLIAVTWNPGDGWTRYYLATEKDASSDAKGSPIPGYHRKGDFYLKLKVMLNSIWFYKAEHPGV